MVKTLSILGSTGSIGQSTVKIIAGSPGKYKVRALTASSNINLLAAQAISLNAEMAVVADQNLYGQLKQLLVGSKVKVAAGEDGLIEAASLENDLVMSAIVGIAGLKPTMAAIRAGADIALANKECLVCAGDLMTKEITKCGNKLIPVDSEHNAIFQIFDFANPHEVEKIILTASGGPFRLYPKDKLASVTIKEALNHPNWQMGAKITIDSATMMNKALEIIEAQHLFNIDPDKIEVLIHPESIIHSMVSYRGGSVLAQLGVHDMAVPIAYALDYPRRNPFAQQQLDFAKLAKLTFAEPDHDKFPALSLVRKVLEMGKAYHIMMNGANEVAVAAFLAGDINFTSIIEVVSRVVDNLVLQEPTSIDEVLHIDSQARAVAQELIVQKRLQHAA